jgi:cell division protein FtsQ
MAREKKEKADKTARREAAPGFGWRRWLAIVVTLTTFASMALAAREVARYVTRDPRFTLSKDRPGSLQVRGLTYASRQKVARVFASDFERSLYNVPLHERRRRLLAIDWVEDAAVARVWPDRLLVTIQERKPVAFVHSRSSVLLIDRNGVLLEPPVRARLTLPVLAGVDENQPESERGRRAAAMLRLMRELGGQAKDVSEVNASDPEDLKVIAQAGERTVELHIGDGNFASRYQTFRNAYPEIQKRSPNGRVFDLRLDGRVLERE